MHGVFTSEEHADQGFTYPIADYRLTRDPTPGFRTTFVNVKDPIIETRTRE
jgi:hypothetical protein